MSQLQLQASSKKVPSKPKFQASFSRSYSYSYKQASFSRSYSYSYNSLYHFLFAHMHLTGRSVPSKVWQRSQSVPSKVWQSSVWEVLSPPFHLPEGVLELMTSWGDKKGNGNPFRSRQLAAWLPSDALKATIELAPGLCATGGEYCKRLQPFPRTTLEKVPEFVDLARGHGATWEEYFTPADYTLKSP